MMAGFRQEVVAVMQPPLLPPKTTATADSKTSRTIQASLPAAARFAAGGQVLPVEPLPSPSDSRFCRPASKFGVDAESWH